MVGKMWDIMKLNGKVEIAVVYEFIQESTFLFSKIVIKFKWYK